jgi:hypothetical protein
MKKEIIKPFDLEKAKAGAKLRTRCGLPVEIFKWNTNSPFPIKGIISKRLEDIAADWTIDGIWCGSSNGDLDLVIVEEVEEPEFWSDDEENTVKGYYIDSQSFIRESGTNSNVWEEYRLFATEKQAKSALAMARISQIMANDVENFGGVVTDEEWKNDKQKYVIYRYGSCIRMASTVVNGYKFLAFHTEKQRNLFLAKYPQLVKDYLMIPDEQTK